MVTEAPIRRTNAGRRWIALGVLAAAVLAGVEGARIVHGDRALLEWVRSR
jgi:hypothetical protein